MSESDAESLPPRPPLPRHTTPTWEMELLISGATVFALMQLPGLIDGAVDALMPRFERDAGVLVLLPSVYIKSAVYALIVTFVLHLTTRGYWVALVGLSSVYPDGVRWETLRWGPHYLATIRERMPPLPELIERADNRASQVFGFGLGFALILLAPLLFVSLTAAAAYGLFELFDRRLSWIAWWNVLLAILFLPYAAALMFDRWFGTRLTPGGRAERSLRGTIRIYLRAGFSSFVNFPVTMFVSLLGPRRGGLLIGVLILILASLATAQQYWSNLDSHFGQFGPLADAPRGNARSLDPQHYADQRDPADSMATLPYIASEVVREDYVRLFIPYRPSRDNPALAEACPNLMSVATADSEAALDCLATLYAVSLDGIRIADPQFDRATDPVNRMRGVVAMIRAVDLHLGRHELEVARPFEANPDPGEPPLPPYRIPFWR